jgi:hypothetical protein
VRAAARVAEEVPAAAPAEQPTLPGDREESTTPPADAARA